MRRVLAAALLCVTLGCDGAPPPDAPDAAIDGGTTPTRCESDLECDDRMFCTGVERCSPSAPGADSRGCVAGSAPCAATQTCDEGADRCVTACDREPDADGDGVRSVDCGGADCDDADANRFPGNREFCDTEHHDEDCDPLTFGIRDSDADDAPDALCCNIESDGVTRHCGTDCDDMRAGVNPDVPEVCNGRDDDCDGMTDEEVTVPFYTDDDGDTHGVAADPAPMMGCPGAAPMGFAETADDCDDTRSDVHPALPERCDMPEMGAPVDEDCDGEVNEDCTCTGTMVRDCTLPGECMAGREMCIEGSWGMCSIMPAPEECDGEDDDCDGATDEGMRVDCYPDVDGDTYAPSGAMVSSQCRAPSRMAVGECPVGFTNRAPAAGATDCDDLRLASSPVGIEVCNMLDDDCDGTPDDGVAVDCYVDDDDDGFARTGATLMRLCPDPARGLEGFCPFRFTNLRPTTSASTDCNDVASMRGAEDYPMAPELCDTRDNDCDAIVDETTMVLCYRDADDDGFSATGAASSMHCRATGRESRGGCPTGFTFRAPGATPDCNDADPLRYPTRIEECNSTDDDCDMIVDEGARVICYSDPDDDGYAGIGITGMMVCASPDRPAVGGCPSMTTNVAPSSMATRDCQPTNPAVRPGATELCNSVDDDCDGSTDEGFMQVTCYADADDDGIPPAGAVASTRCPDPSRPARGNCPVGFTSTMPTSVVNDCADTDPSRRWPLVPCWRDDDGDGYACPTTDTTAYSCMASGGRETSTRVDQCPTMASTCDPGFTSREPERVARRERL